MSIKKSSLKNVKRQNAEVLQFHGKRAESDEEKIPVLMYQVLNVVAQYEGRNPVDILKEIENRKQPHVDIVSAAIIFLITYLSHYLQEKNSSTL